MHGRIGKSSNARPKATNGDSDGKPSSLDVLVRWLETPGNYMSVAERKAAMCDEILPVMKTAGITHRSADAINSKIRLMEQRWEDAKTWLKELGLFVLYQNAGVDKNVRASVIRLCPAYDRVTPVFRRALSAGEVEIEDEADSSHAVTKTKARASQEKKVCMEEDERRHRQEVYGVEFGAKKVQALVRGEFAQNFTHVEAVRLRVAPDEVDASLLLLA
ncbi:hypothetical protein Pcac1_g16008 [Phytophthora cactorum]|nr:hypothetical protein Pcac1_g16008 [Phytophthora cactorum]